MTKSTWGTQGAMWPAVRPPFAPSAEDLDLYQQACPPALLAEEAAPRILVLGVTPHLVHAPWPKAGELHAVDYDQAMIDSLWTPRDGAHVHLGRWQEMDFPDDHFDVVVGDCSFNALPSGTEYDAVLRQVDRVRKPGAPLISRFFMLSEPRRTLAQVIEDVSGALAHARPPARKLLTLMAAANAHGVMHNRDVPDRIRAEWGEVDDYYAALGESGDELALTKKVLTFDQRVNYPTAAEIRERFEPYFRDIRFAYPDYDIGQNCPLVRFA